MPRAGSAKPKPLRRSASTASLPTPPRTTHKRKRSTLSNASSVADSDDEALSLSSDDEAVSSKRPRLALNDADADAFWLGSSDSPAQQQQEDSSDDVPLVVRNYQKRVESSLASPPPSFRQNPGSALASPPHTPPRKATKQLPIRDSPSNPFLDSPCASDEEIEYNPPSDLHQPSITWEEKPTITMLYRGQKREFANPHYDPVTRRSKPINPNSLLDPSHPDFEPDFRMQPRVLFPKKKKKKAATNVSLGGASSKLKSIPDDQPRLPDPFAAASDSIQEESIDRYLANIASATPV